MTRRMHWFAAFTLTALAAGAARADTVLMRNGDRLSGKILHMSARTLTLRTTYAGKLELPRGKVASISTDGPATLLLESGAAPRRGRLARAGPGRVEFRPAGGNAPRRDIALTQVRFINPTPAESGTGVEYRGHVTVSGSRVQGNSSGSTLNGEAALKARARTYRYAVRGSVNQASLGGSTVTSNWILSAHIDRFVVDRSHFQYLRGSLQRDRFKDVRLKTTAGAGYGWQLLATDVTRLSLRGGLDLVAVDRYTTANQRYPALGWGVDFSRWLWEHRVKLFHVQDGYWNLSHRGDVTLRTRTGLRVPIAEGLLANAEVDVDWDRRPPPGVKPTDTTVLFGLGYEW